MPSPYHIAGLLYHASWAPLYWALAHRACRGARPGLPCVADHKPMVSSGHKGGSFDTPLAPRVALHSPYSVQRIYLGVSVRLDPSQSSCRRDLVRQCSMRGHITPCDCAGIRSHPDRYLYGVIMLCKVSARHVVRQIWCRHVFRGVRGSPITGGRAAAKGVSQSALPTSRNPHPRPSLPSLHPSPLWIFSSSTTIILRQSSRHASSQNACHVRGAGPDLRRAHRWGTSPDPAAIPDRRSENHARSLESSCGSRWVRSQANARAGGHGTWPATAALLAASNSSRSTYSTMACTVEVWRGSQSVSQSVSHTKRATWSVCRFELAPWFRRRRPWELGGSPNLGRGARPGSTASTHSRLWRSSLRPSPLAAYLTRP